MKDKQKKKKIVLLCVSLIIIFCMINLINNLANISGAKQDLNAHFAKTNYEGTSPNIQIIYEQQEKITQNKIWVAIDIVVPLISVICAKKYADKINS